MVILAGDYVILKVLLGRYVTPEVVAAHLKPLPRASRCTRYSATTTGGRTATGSGARWNRSAWSCWRTRRAEVTLGQCRLWLVGVGDLWEGHPDIPRAFAEVDDDAPVIAITHNPELFPQMPARASLVIAGHTHGGQVAAAGAAVDALRPLHRGPIVEDGRQLFVTPGIGTSILPFRFRVPPEISRLTLHAAR